MARFGRAHVEEEERENHERWLVSYADMITLLAALFIVLFAMSRLDVAKFQAFAKALRQGLGGDVGAFQDSGKSPLGSSAGVVDAPSLGGMALSPRQLGAARLLFADQAQQAASEQKAALSAAKQSIQTALDAQHLSDSVTFRTDARGLIINIVTDQVLFDLGSAQISPAGRKILDALAPTLRNLPNQMGVEGHTDNQPVLGGHGTNWELSTARATAVLRYLVERQQLPATRVYAAGYGEQRPLVPNDSAAHRATNRRVEIVVLADTSAANGANSTTGPTSVPTTVPTTIPTDVFSLGSSNGQ